MGQYPLDVRGFAYVAAAVLIVIGIGVGLLAATNGAGTKDTIQTTLATVEGTFFYYGGPPPGDDRGPFQLRLISLSDSPYVYTTFGDHDVWSIRVPPGRYRVQPMFCNPSGPIVVRSGETVRGLHEGCGGRG